jgi:hypothetical protein
MPNHFKYLEYDCKHITACNYYSCSIIYAQNSLLSSSHSLKLHIIINTATSIAKDPHNSALKLTTDKVSLLSGSDAKLLVILAEFLLEDRELLWLHELFDGHAGLSVDDVVAGGAAGLQVVRSHQRINLALLVHPLLPSSIFSVLVELAHWVHRHSVAVDGHLRPHLVQLQRVRLPLLQSLQVAIVHLLKTQLAVDRLHPPTAPVVLLPLPLLLAVRLVHACVVPLEPFQR